MPLTIQAAERTEILNDIGCLMGTLRSAISTINIGENVVGCAIPVATSRDIARSRIALIRQDIERLESLI